MAKQSSYMHVFKWWYTYHIYIIMMGVVSLQQWCGENWCLPCLAHCPGACVGRRIDRCLPDSEESSHTETSHGPDLGMGGVGLILVRRVG